MSIHERFPCQFRTVFSGGKKIVIHKSFKNISGTHHLIIINMWCNFLNIQSVSNEDAQFD